MQSEFNKKGSHRDPFCLCRLYIANLAITYYLEHYFELSTAAGFSLAARDAGYHVASKLRTMAVPETQRHPSYRAAKAEVSKIDITGQKLVINKLHQATR